MDLQRSARRSLGNWRHPLLGRPIGSMVGPPRPWLPRGKRFGNRLPMLPSRSGSVFLAAAGSTWLPAGPDTGLMVPAHAGLRPASLPTTDSNMPCTCPSELSGSYILLRRALRSRLSEPMGVQIGSEIPPSTTTGPSDHRPPFVCSNSAHPPSILPCHSPSGGLSPHPTSAPGTSPDVSGRRAALCSLPSSCTVGALNRGSPRRGKLLTPSSNLPSGCTDTADQQ